MDKNDSVNIMPVFEQLEHRLLLSGTTYVIDSLLDVVADDDLLTLREAIEASNTNTAVNEAAAGSDADRDVITFAPGLAGGTIVLNGNKLDIKDDLLIQGLGAKQMTVDGNDQSSIFDIYIGAVCVEISGLTLTSGANSNYGAAISVNQAELVLTDSIVTESNGGRGGAVYSSGPLTIDNVIMTDNSSNVGGAIYSDGSLQLSNSTLTGNRSYSDGGAIYSDGETFIINSTITGNHAGDVTVGSWTVNKSGHGGGIYSTDKLNIKYSTISKNRAKSSGGGIYQLKDMAGSALDVVVVYSYIAGNVANGYGGGICNDSDKAVAVTNSLVADNYCGVSGGGIYSPNGVTLQSTTVAGNIASYTSGVYAVRQNYQYPYFPNIVNVTNSIIANNYNEKDISQSIDLNESAEPDNKYYVSIIGRDPGFVRTHQPGPDGLWATEDDIPGDYHLQAHGEAVERSSQYKLPIDVDDLDGDGDVTEYSNPYDLAGHYRINGEKIDAGAFEYQWMDMASEYVVDTNEDNSGDNDGIVSLHEAVATANYYGAMEEYEDQVFTIRIDPSLAGNTLQLEHSVLEITANVNIIGINDNPLVIKAPENSRVLYIDNPDATVKLSGLVLAGGRYANKGAGIYNNATLELDHVTVSDNEINTVSTSNKSGGGIYNDGGTLSIYHSNIIGNASGDSGGGIFSYGGDVVIVDSMIKDNVTWARGGGLSSGSSNITVVNSQFLANSAMSNGGGISSGGILELVNSVFIGNTAQNGGAISAYGSATTITHSVVTENHATEDGGGISTSHSHANINNSIVTKNTAKTQPNIATDSNEYRNNNSLIGSDPKFIRKPSYGKDRFWGTADDDFGDLRLQPKSPALNAGDSAWLPVDVFDLDGDQDTVEPLPVDYLNNPRVLDGSPDLGIYENIYFCDLVAEVGNPKLPGPITSGDGKYIQLPITVSNVGNIAVDQGQKIDIAVVARPVNATDDSQDIHVATVLNQAVSGLKPYAVKPFKVKVYLPAGMATDDYILITQVDSSSRLGEADETNNSAATDPDDPIHVNLGEVDLTGRFEKVSLPTAIVTGQVVKSKVSVAVVNEGNIAVSSGQKINVAVYLRPTEGGQDILIGNAVNQSISRLLPGKSKRMTISVNADAQLPEGEYQLVAKVDSSNAVNVERSENNNVLVCQTPLVCASPFVDLTAEIVNPKLFGEVIFGEDLKITVPIVLTNSGNIPVSRGQKIDVAICMRPTDAIDDSQDVYLTTLTSQSVSSLKPAAVTKINAKVLIPSDLAVGQYVLVAKVDISGHVIEADENNNTATSDVHDAVHVALGEVDLTATFGKVTLPPAIVPGQKFKSKVPVNIVNAGNIPVARNQKLTVDLYLQPVGGGDDILLASAPNQSVSNLQPGRSKTVNISVAHEGNLPEGDYELVARVDSNNDIADERSEDNNSVIYPLGFTCAQPFVDLVAEIIKPRLPDHVVSGDGARITLPVNITNVGNIAIERNQRIDLTVYARPSDIVDASQDVAIATIENQSVSNLKPGAVKKINVNTYLPAGLDANHYVLAVKVDSSQSVNEADEQNNIAVSSASDSIEAERGFIAFDVALSEKAKIPRLLLADDKSQWSIPIVITNRGNVSTDSKATAEVTVALRESGGGEGSDVILNQFEAIKIGRLKPGQSKIVNLNKVTNTAAGLSGDYEIVTTFEANFATDTPQVEITSEPVQFASGVMDLAMLNVPGVVRMFVNGEHNMRSTMNDTNTEDVYEFYHNYLSIDERTLFVFSDTEQGLASNRIKYYLAKYTSTPSIEITYDDAIIAPHGMQVNKSYKATFTGATTYDDNRQGIDINFSTDINTSSKLVGYETVVTPLGQFEVAEISISMKFSGKGTWYDRQARFNMTHTIEFIASPKIGIIGITEKRNLRISISGAGSVSGSSQLSYALDQVSGLPS